MTPCMYFLLIFDTFIVQCDVEIVVTNVFFVIEIEKIASVAGAVHSRRPQSSGQIDASAE